MEVLTPRTSGTRAKEASGTGCQVPRYTGAGPHRASSHPAQGLPTSLLERWGHQVVGMSSCRPASSTRRGLLI